MLTAERNQLLDQLLGISIADFDIPDDLYQLAVRRYEEAGAWLSHYWDRSPADGIVYPQGSFRLGTVVQPIRAGGEYDVDMVCRRDILKTSTTQAALKLDLGQGLGLYVASRPEGSPTRSEGDRCWTLAYPFEPFHMDFLPALPDVEAKKQNAILLPDKHLREWQHSNPIDYADWFHGRMHEEFVELQDTVAKRMDVADMPLSSIKTTLQRTVQALKRHRDMYFTETPKARPASIIITTLAGLAYEGGGTLYEVLVKIAAKMPGLVERRNGVYWVANPVHHEENFADRWRNHPDRARTFFQWMERVQRDFCEYGADLGVDNILEKIAKSLGEQHAKRAGEDFGSGLSQARVTGALGMASGSGLLGAVGRRPVPQHTFHGSQPGRRGG